MEKRSRNTRSQSFFVGLFLFKRILSWVCQNLYYGFLPSSLSKLKIYFDVKRIMNSEDDDKLITKPSQQCCVEDQEDVLLTEEVRMVMEGLGVFCNPEGEKLQDLLGCREFSVLFDEKEPSLEEVREAFSVFDQNKDDFVDAKDLQRVLSVLGFRQGSSIDACEQMIRAFDENGDGRIDFNEFVKFMEKSFC
ncbi:probable calcium-binding protein CML45 [Aristolochia californica]|uniref:probable calcium-binding protein CML45 n=1 Tax=Aristolochia californica TaxID=171875 RepID=UPI0035D57BE4